MPETSVPCAFIRHLCHHSNLVLLHSLKQQTVSINSCHASFAILALLNWVLQGCLRELRSALGNHQILLFNPGKRNGISHRKVVSNKLDQKCLTLHKCISWGPLTQPSAEFNPGDQLPATKALNYCFNNHVLICVGSPLQKASQVLLWPHRLGLLSVRIHPPRLRFNSSPVSACRSLADSSFEGFCFWCSDLG